MRTTNTRPTLLSITTMLAVATAAACSSSSSPVTTSGATAASTTRALSGRYVAAVQATERGVPAAILGIQSIWFSGKGDYQLILAHCAANCEELGIYTVDDSNQLTLKSFAGPTHVLKLGAITMGASATSASVRLRNTGDSASSDDACGATTDAYQDSTTDGSDDDASGCAPPRDAASSLGVASDDQGDPIGDGVTDDPSTPGLSRVAGSKEKSGDDGTLPSKSGVNYNQTGTCPGAVGPNCSLRTGPGFPIGNTCDKVDGSNDVECDVSIGSLAHDSCCGDHPDGVRCGGSGTPTNDCQEAWNRAQNDYLAHNYWRQRFTPGRAARSGWHAVEQSNSTQNYWAPSQPDFKNDGLCIPDSGYKLSNAGEGSFCCNLPSDSDPLHCQ